MTIPFLVVLIAGLSAVGLWRSNRRRYAWLLIACIIGMIAALGLWAGIRDVHQNVERSLEYHACITEHGKDSPLCNELTGGYSTE